MTGSLDLPFEVREIIYNNVMPTIIAGRRRIFWVPDVLERDINHQAFTITYRKARNFRQQANGPFVAFRHNFPTIHHPDITSLISLAQTCQFLHKEVSKLAWKVSDFKVQGNLDMIRGLLCPRLALCMSLVSKSSITSLELIINEPWKTDGLEALKEIVEVINIHLPALEVLTLSFPHVKLHVPGSSLTMHSLCRPAKVMLAQLLFLRPDLLVDFKGYYHTMRYNYSHCHSNYNAHTLTHSKVVELLKTNYAISRAKAIDRQRKKVQSDCLDPDCYIHITLGLRSSTHYEAICCCFDHKIQNHLREIHLPGLKMTTRCASPDSNGRALILKSAGGENGLFRIGY
ncbi:hypothetical protein KCU91_g11411, partial [Aureobasidium melanogenum]